MTPILPKTVLTTALLLALSWSAHAALNLSDPIPVGPQVKVGKLANGLTYYIQNNAMPAQKVELRLVVKAGSILEDDDQQGLAHFIEHMAFNGSTHFKKHELVSYLQSIGVKFGADLNAYTSFDETVYILPIPTDKKENIDTAFQVLEDWAGGATLNDADIDKERDIILEEARLGKGSSDRMNKVLLPKLFNGSKYAQRLPIGQEAIIKNFKYEALKRFYADWYRPDLMAVVVVGDVDPQAAETMIHAHFAGLKNPPKERARSYAPIAARSTSSGLVVTDKEAGSNALLIRYPLQAIKRDVTLGDYRQKLVETLSTAILAQRLQELTQQANPPFLGASSGKDKLAPGYESYSTMAMIGRKGVAPAIAAVVQENERARQLGFSAAELDRSKKNMQRNYDRYFSERDKTDSSSYAAEYIRNFLDSESIPGIANEYQFTSEMLPGITLAEVNHYAQTTIPSKAKKLVVYMGSTKSDLALPVAAKLVTAVDQAERVKVVAKAEKVLATKLMDKLPKPGRIVTETHNKALGLVELGLSNGVKVILKPTDFKNDQVLMSGVRFGGQSLFEQKDMFNARYASSLVGQMGLKTFSPTDVQKVLAGKSAVVQTALSNYTDNFSASAGSSDLETMFQLFYLKLENPRKDLTLYKAFIDGQQEYSKNAMARPEAVFGDALQTAMYANHPRLAHTPRPDDFSHVDVDRALAIYSERFSSVKDLTLIIVGSFDVEKIKPLLATYVASLPARDIVTAYRDLGIRPVAGIVKQDVHSGSEPKSSVSINFSGTATYSEDESLRFQALMDVMNLKITDVLREKLTLIYGGGMGGSLSRIPYGNYLIGVNLPCGPENVDKVIAATFNEIEQIKRDGPQAAELEKVKQNWTKRHQIAMRENGYWLGRLQSSLLTDSDPALILSYEKRINAISADDVKAAAQRYFDTANYVQAVLYPEK